MRAVLMSLGAAVALALAGMPAVALAQTEAEVRTETTTDDDVEVEVQEDDDDVEVQRTTEVETESEGNWAWTIASSTLGGALAGALVGGAIYLIDDGESFEARDIGYAAGIGALAGLGIGVIQVAVRENRVSEATAMGRVQPRDLTPAFGAQLTLRW